MSDVSALGRYSVGSIYPSTCFRIPFPPLPLSHVNYTNKQTKLYWRIRTRTRTRTRTRSRAVKIAMVKLIMISTDWFHGSTWNSNPIVFHVLVCGPTGTANLSFLSRRLNRSFSRLQVPVWDFNSERKFGITRTSRISTCGGCGHDPTVHVIKWTSLNKSREY